MSATSEAEFYVGYRGESPPLLARRTRRTALALVVLAGLLAGTFAMLQRAFPDKVFEFGTHRDFVGRIDAHPYPTLVVERPGQPNGPPRVSRYLLVAFGKIGALEDVEEHDGQLVKLRGSLIYREDQTMIELTEDGLEVLADSPMAAVAATEELGTFTLRGEIVDSKCFLGVMAPGSAKTHRACATRCISGGIPPVLMVRDRRGSAAYLLLVGADGRTLNQEVLDMIAEPVEISGQVVRHDNLLVLRADPETYLRLE